MEFLGSAIKILIFLAVVFFVVFSYICLLWTERDTKKLSNILGACIVSLLHTFKILLYGSLLMVATYIVIGFFKSQ